jgi:hypothetical protein
MGEGKNKMGLDSFLRCHWVPETSFVMMMQVIEESTDETEREREREENLCSNFQADLDLNRSSIPAASGASSSIFRKTVV